MTKADLVEKIKVKLGFHTKDSVELLESLLEIMKDTIAQGEDLKISCFGKFAVRKKADRRGRNPQTGEDITIYGRRVLTFRPSQVLKDFINS
jgi:integration host factor subunit alpha